jgi:cell division protein FtsB
MTDNEMELMEKGNSRLLTLNKVEAAIGVGVLCCTLLSGYSSLKLLPYKVEQLEKKNEQLAQKMEAQAVEFRAELKAVKDGFESQKELIIRMDERLKTIQGALKIPTAQ